MPQGKRDGALWDGALWGGCWSVGCTVPETSSSSESPSASSHARKLRAQSLDHFHPPRPAPKTKMEPGRTWQPACLPGCAGRRSVSSAARRPQSRTQSPWLERTRLWVCGDEGQGRRKTRGGEEQAVLRHPSRAGRAGPHGDIQYPNPQVKQERSCACRQDVSERGRGGLPLPAKSAESSGRRPP